MTGPEDIPAVLIVGAGRSGTNLLARCFAADPRFVNLFENRWIWNYGQRDLRTERRHPREATPRVSGYIAGHFARIAAGTGRIPVDKTPGNALRLGFALSVMPRARVVNILRDGRANTVSRSALWDRAGPDGPSAGRYWRQFRDMRARGNIPNDRLGRFLADHGARRLASALRRRPALSGERLPGLAEIAAVEGMEVARAVQWRETVMASVVEGRRLGPERYHEIRFEDLIARPQEVWTGIFAFLGMEVAAESVAFVTDGIDRAPLTSWRREADAALLDRLEPWLRPTLDFLGYRDG